MLSKLAQEPCQQALRTAEAVQWQLQVALGAGLVAITFWGVQRVVFPYAAHRLRSWSGKPDKSDKQQQESQIATVNTAAGILTSALSIMLIYFLDLPIVCCIVVPFTTLDTHQSRLQYLP